MPQLLLVSFYCLHINGFQKIKSSNKGRQSVHSTIYPPPLSPSSLSKGLASEDALSIVEKNIYVGLFKKKILGVL